MMIKNAPQVLSQHEVESINRQVHARMSSLFKTATPAVQEQVSVQLKELGGLISDIATDLRQLHEREEFKANHP